MLLTRWSPAYSLQQCDQTDAVTRHRKKWYSCFKPLQLCKAFTCTPNQAVAVPAFWTFTLKAARAVYADGTFRHTRWAGAFVDICINKSDCHWLTACGWKLLRKPVSCLHPAFWWADALMGFECHKNLCRILKFKKSHLKPKAMRFFYGENPRRRKHYLICEQWQRFAWRAQALKLQ